MSKENKNYKKTVAKMGYSYLNYEDAKKLENALKKIPKSYIKMLIKIGEEEQYKLERE